MNQSAVFLAGSILIMAGLIVIVAGTVFINNIIHKYWKSFGWRWCQLWHYDSPRFAEPHELDKGREPKV